MKKLRPRKAKLLAQRCTTDEEREQKFILGVCGLRLTLCFHLYSQLLSPSFYSCPVFHMLTDVGKGALPGFCNPKLYREQFF